MEGHAFGLTSAAQIFIVSAQTGFISGGEPGVEIDREVSHTLANLLIGKVAVVGESRILIASGDDSGRDLFPIPFNALR
jgi:hypothetical protein